MEKYNKTNVLKVLKETKENFESKLPSHWLGGNTEGICRVIFNITKGSYSDWDNNPYLILIRNNKPTLTNVFKEVYPKRQVDYPAYYWPLRDLESRIIYLEILIKGIKNNSISLN